MEPPEGNGSLHVGAQALVPFAQEMFTGLLRFGFSNIHFFIHHRSENFAASMPTGLALKSPRGRRFLLFRKDPWRGLVGQR